MSIKIPSHLFRNKHGTFYFRWVLPKDLRAFANQNEVRFSLYTESRQKALALALPIIRNIPQHLAELRKMSENGQDKIGEGNLSAMVRLMRENISLKEELSEAKEKLLDFESIILKSTPKEKAISLIMQAYDKGKIKATDDLVKDLVFPWPAEKTAKFSELQTAFMKHLRNRPTGAAKKPPNEKTIHEYTQSIGVFIEVLGDIKIGSITRDVVSNYFQILKQLPANRSRVKEYRGKSIEEIIALGGEPQSEVNVSKKIERISAMFKWALEEKRVWGIDANPFTGYGQSKNNINARRPFSNTELIQLLTHPSYEKMNFRSSYAFWLIPLALFTGARLGELCQLDIKDFIEVEGIACIDINDDAAVEEVTEGNKTKKVKNNNAKRLVPIHSELIRIGLLRYVEQLKTKGEKHFFPELNRNRRDGPGHAASNWFQRYRKQVGLIEKQATVFHSFRHYFITKVLDNNVAPHMLAPIVGHEAELVTGQVYWNKRDATARKPTVDLFVLKNEISNLIPNIENVRISG